MGIRPAGMPSGPQGMRGGFQPPMGGRGGISRGRGLLGMYVRHYDMVKMNFKIPSILWKVHKELQPSKEGYEKCVRRRCWRILI